MKEARYKRPHIVGFHLCEMSKICKSIETESRLVVARDSGRRGPCLLKSRVSLWGDILWCLGVAMVAQL